MAVENIFITIVIVLAVARLLGELFRRIKQPALIGELLGGMILGPSLLSIPIDENLPVFTNMAVFFLMLLAGLEMDLSEIRKAGRKAIVISVLAFIIPFISGSQIGILFGLDIIQALFVGLLLSLTAIPVSSIILMEFGILKSKVGNTVITAAVINDILALAVLSIILQFNEDSVQQFDFLNIGISLSKSGLFLAEIALLALILSKTTHWLPNKVEFFIDKLRTKEASFGILLVLAITLSLIAHFSSLHFIVGTFFAGLIFGKKFFGEKHSERARSLVSGITFGFFAPVFFGFIGLEFNIFSIIDSLPLLLVLLGIAISAKIGGGYIGARIVRFSNNNSIAIGCLMNGRGMVELAIASIGFAVGILDLSLFSIGVIIGFITTLITPFIAKPFVNKIKSENEI